MNVISEGDTSYAPQMIEQGLQPSLNKDALALPLQWMRFAARCRASGYYGKLKKRTVFDRTFYHHHRHAHEGLDQFTVHGLKAPACRREDGLRLMCKLKYDAIRSGMGFNKSRLSTAPSQTTPTPNTKLWWCKGAPRSKKIPSICGVGRSL